MALIECAELIRQPFILLKSHEEERDYSSMTEIKMMPESQIGNTAGMLSKLILRGIKREIIIGLTRAVRFFI